MTHRDESMSREDGEKGKMKEEEMKEPGSLNFLSKLVQEEDLRPEVATSYRKLTWTMVNQFHQEMKSCITFVHAENQVMRNTVTEGMKEIVEAFTEAQKEHGEKTQLEMENLRTQLRSLEGELQQRSRTLNHRSEGPKPSKPNNFGGDRAKGKEWLRTIHQCMDLCSHEFTSDAVTIGWILLFFKEGRVDGFVQEAYDYKEWHEDQWKWSSLVEFLSEFREEFYEQESETVAFLRLEGTEYFQGKRSTSDYCNSFTKLVQMMDHRMIVSKFCRRLCRDVDEVISKDIGLVLDDPNLWYRKSKDFELVVKFNKAYHDAHTPTHRGTYSFCTPVNFAASTPSSGTPSATTKPTSSPEPAKVDGPHTKFSLRLNCWNCGEEGHPVWQCTKLKDETKTKVQVMDMPEENLLALARIGLKVVEEEQELLGKDF
jgi:hypothetical protein